MISEKIGIANIRISGDNRYRLLSRLIKSSISIKEMTDSGNTISGRVELSKLKKLKQLCAEYKVELEIVEEQGIIVEGRRYYKHYGLFAGIAVALAIMIYLSNIVLHIRVIGADYDTRQEIQAVLEDLDIKIGTSMNDINFFRLETALTKDTNSIAWAGVRRNGSELVINVSQTKQIPDITQKRYPSSIIATRDAVITGFQVYSGSIDFMLGDAVAKGQILISGEYQDRDGNLLYRYSQASITGKFTDIQVFYEPYEYTAKIIYEDDESRKFFRFFNSDISFFSEEIAGRYIEHKSINYWQFLGLELPIGITNATYDRYEYETTVRNEEEVRYELEKDIKNYESNFLSEYDIIDKDIKYAVSDTGITATVTYIAEGEIGETKLIFPKK